ncbi:MAG: energy-coupling factor transporter transmembrane component T family protein [Limisphaerales bacterium]
MKNESPPGPIARVGADFFPPATRILLAVAWIFIIALAPNPWWRWQGVVLLALILLSVRWGLSFRALVRRLLVLWPFVGLIAAGLIGQREWPLRVGNLIGKATLCLWIMSLLMHATPADQLVAGLRRLRVPRLWVELFAFWNRYFVVVTEEWSRMRQARQARAFRWNRRRELLVLTNSLGLLFVRAYERAEQIHQAMLARGYSWRHEPQHAPLGISG